MVVKRCAWHRRAFGYPILFGVTSWYGWGVYIVDGICGRCTARIRRDLAAGRRSSWEAPLALPPTLVMVVAAIVIVLAAQPLHIAPPVSEPLDNRQAAANAGPAAEQQAPARGTDEGQAASVGAVPALVHASPPVPPAEALIPPPEHVVYVPGWRVLGVSSVTSTPRPPLSARLAPPYRDETRWPRPGPAVQSQ